MGFFENAYDFDIYGGRFYDIRGDQVNADRDDSTRIGQRGNETYISPSLSHQDDKTCGVSHRLSIRSSIQNPLSRPAGGPCANRSSIFYLQLLPLTLKK